MNQAWKRRFCWVKERKFSRLWAELVAAVRRRGRGDSDDDDDDPGLPRSPPASPLTDKADKRHHAGISQSSCSDGSLLSVGSSEMDDDSSSGHHHAHDHSARSDHSDLYNSSEPPSGVAPLSHSAAKHKMAVRPRRTHGAPRRKKNNSIAASALPITPELNEEITRSTTPEVTHKTSEVVTETFSSSTTKHQIVVKEQHQQLNKELQMVLETPNDTKLKSSSLPPGLALSHLGQSQAKLSIAESNTPRSSIKRSKSSSQDQTIREDSPKPTIQTLSHTHERVSKHRSEKKYVEESCLEKKSKSEKRLENEGIRSAKKEESFFSRLLLRKSGKKSKKDQMDGESQEVKKTKTEKTSAHYKSMDMEKGFYFEQDETYKPVPAERSYKTAGQKVFANHMHKRIDTKGAYVHDGAYKDVYSAAKVSGVEYNITDLKVADETDKILNYDTKRFSRREEFNLDRVEKCKRSSSKDAIDNKRESFSLHHDKTKRPSSVQRLIDPYATKAFLVNEVANRAQEEAYPRLEIEEEKPSLRGIKIKSMNNDYVFHSGSMPKNLPYFNPSISVSSSPKKHINYSSENVKFLSRSVEPEFREREIVSKRETIHNMSKTEESYMTSGYRSAGDDYIEHRSGIGKSQSFRYASESASISSQENQLPSLPAIVGISEPLLESWEVNYRRNLSETHDYSKRLSARNYGILQGNTDVNFDSLPSTDSSYLDSLKTDTASDMKLFTNNIQITNKRDSDISQIEAKIDDIISSPKPLIAPILKSNSLDSIKGSPEKHVEDRRKTISVESALSQTSKNNQKDIKIDDNFISVTHVNKESSPAFKSIETTKAKSEERIQRVSNIKPGVPEFLNVQLNKVDAKPVTNVVLTANVTPKKVDSPQAEKDLDYENFFVTETKPTQTQVKPRLSESLEPSEEKPMPAVLKSNTASPTPASPLTPKHSFIKKAANLEERLDKPRTNSLSTDGSNEKIDDNISLGRKSHSSFGSKSSIQSLDSNENKTPDRHEETVIFRKKPMLNRDKGDKKDDEPELMKVFARRSLKIKDSEADQIAQEIAEANAAKKESENVTAMKSKTLKNEFNASIKSRDSDKENDEKEQVTENNFVDIATRVSQFGVPHYQRSVSIHSVSAKRESTPSYKSEVSKYKKEVSDSTPEKRLRNRTFPDPSNDREDFKNITKPEAYKADTLSKRPWQREFRQSIEKEKRESSVIEKESDSEKCESEKEREEADASPQFKGILQMRAEWERRAKQGMTK